MCACVSESPTSPFSPIFSRKIPRRHPERLGATVLEKNFKLKCELVFSLILVCVKGTKKDSHYLLVSPSFDTPSVSFEAVTV